MSNPEKWAWWTLGVVALTAAAYTTFFEVLGHSPAINSVFALLALTALTESKGRAIDERDLEIANKAFRVGLGGFWLAFVSLVTATGFIKGWSVTLSVPLWILVESVFWAWNLVLGVKAATTVVLYRGGSHV